MNKVVYIIDLERVDVWKYETLMDNYSWKQMFTSPFVWPRMLPIN